MIPSPSVSMLSTRSGSPYTASLASALSRIPSPSKSTPSTTPSLLASMIPASPVSVKSLIPSLSLSRSRKLNKPSPSVSSGPSVVSGSPNTVSLLSALSRKPSPSVSGPSTTPSLLASIIPAFKLTASFKSFTPSLSLSRSSMSTTPSVSLSAGASVRSGSPNKALLASALFRIPSLSESGPSTNPSLLASTNPVLPLSTKS